MLVTAPIREAQRCALSPADNEVMQSDPDLCRRAAVVRSSIPAVTHVDLSARVQTVDRTRHPAFHALLSEFYRQTGCPLLINTSFNVRGEPIVCTPADAYRCFLVTEMDVLVLEDCIIEKQPHESPLSSSGPVSSSGPERKRRRTADWSTPSTRQLREFAFVGAFVFAVVAAWQEMARGSVALVVANVAAAAVAMSIGLVKPRWLAPIFTTWMILAFPLAWIVSTLLLAIIFYGLIAPLGLWFRLIGRDPLDRRFRSEQDSYWQEKPAAANSRRYFQQF